MNFFKNKRGSVSIFLVIIMVPVIAVTTIFVDVSRIKLAQEVVMTSGDLALNSVLTQYDKELSDYYGMMASCQSVDEFYEVAQGYFERCIVSQGIDTSLAQELASTITNALGTSDHVNDFLKMSSSETKIESLSNADLANSAMMQEEIMEFMKYRAPIELTADIANGARKNGLYQKLNSVKESIENMETESRVMKEKTEYYEAENELLKEALTVYNKLKEYENNGFTLEMLDPINEHTAELENVYKELHRDYVRYWANTASYETTYFQSIQAAASSVPTTFTDGKYSAGDLKTAINNCKSTNQTYITKRTEFWNTVTASAPFYNETLDDTNKTQYWVQMVDKTGTAYNEYKNALVSFLTAYNKMVYEFKDENRNIYVTEEDKDPVEYEKDENGNYKTDANGNYIKVKVEVTHDPQDEIYEGSTKLSDDYSSAVSSYQSDYNGYSTRQEATLSQKIADASKQSIDEGLVKRSTASTRIKEALNNLKQDYKDLQKAQKILEELSPMLTGLEDKVDAYVSSYETWKNDVDANSGLNSSIINTDKEEIATIEGEGDPDKGLEKVTIEKDSVEKLKARVDRTIEMYKSYRETIESLRYRGTVIFGTSVDSSLELYTTSTGIKDLSSFDSAAKSQANGCTAPVVNHSTNPIPVNKTELQTYIDNTWDYSDKISERKPVVTGQVANANEPEFHEYTVGPEDTGDELAFDRWLHSKFDSLDKTMEEIDGIYNTLKTILKGLKEAALGQFSAYDNSGNINMANEIKNTDTVTTDDEGNEHHSLPSAGAGEDTECIFDDTEESDELTSETEQGSNAGAIFGGINFLTLLTEGRDSLYATTYIMNMFSYETFALEGMYDLSRNIGSEHRTSEDSKIYRAYNLSSANWENITGPAAAGTMLYDNTELIGNESSNWKSELLDVTYNKSLTNKMINRMTEEGSSTEYTGNNWSYGNEVEYILYGGTNANNKKKINTTLYFTRYVLNLVPVFSEYWSGNTIVESIASAISSATCGIIPIPLIKLVICLGVNAAESAVDLNYLKSGLPVKFVKADDELFISLDFPNDFADTLKSGGSVNSEDIFVPGVVNVTENDICFSYSDYISIFLFISLMTDSKDYIYKRTADVIQVNISKNTNIENYSDFQMQKAKTYFSISSDIKVKPMMVKLPYTQSYGADMLDTSKWNTFSYKQVKGY